MCSIYSIRSIYSIHSIYSIYNIYSIHRVYSMMWFPTDMRTGCLCSSPETVPQCTARPTGNLSARLRRRATGNLSCRKVPHGTVHWVCEGPCLDVCWCTYNLQCRATGNLSARTVPIHTVRWVREGTLFEPTPTPSKLLFRVLCWGIFLDKYDFY